MSLREVSVRRRRVQTKKWCRTPAVLAPKYRVFFLSAHRLTYRRTNHDNLHVRGYKEEGTTTTPFDMTVLNDLDRFHLAGDVIDRVPRLQGIASHVKQMLRNRLIDHKLYIAEHGDDMPEI